MKILLSMIALCLCVFAANIQAAAPVISVRTIAPQSVEAGKTAILVVELDIPHPYHINSDRPLESYLIPTTIAIDPLPGITIGKTTFPAPLVKKLPISEAPMAVFEDKVRIEVELMPAAGVDSKTLKLSGKVRYQACNDTTCFPPVSLPFNAALSAVLSQDSNPAAAAGGAGAQARGSVDFGSRSLLVTFVLVFLGGLALNLTPCVYPMIPITITYFGGQAQGRKGSIFIHSGLYVIGMAVTYSVLGVVAAMTGGLFGAALQYPPVLIGIALIMVALALSMFDVYELRMPQFLNRLAGGSQKGFAGTFLMGLTVGIVAAPCIGPFVLGLLTYVGNRQNVLLGFALFFVLALGLGVPFILLGIFSGSLSRLPRSGAWMVWVRKIFGFILLAMAVYFLQPLFTNPLSYFLTLALIMLLAGIYLAWIDAVPGTGKVFSFVRTIVGIVFFAAALYSAVTAFEGNAGNAAARRPEGNAGPSVQWLEYSESALIRASKESKPVFIDFYADWCVPCKELDAQTFSDPEVVDRSREFIMLKADLTLSDNPQSESLTKKYQVRGVPTLVFLTPDGREIADLRGTGFEPKEVFLEKMNRALRFSASN